MVWVTNKGEEFHVDYWGGEKFSFPPQKSVELSEELARQMFGFGVEDKTSLLVRLGWTKYSNDMPAALERLAKFEISETQPQTYHNVSPVVDRVPFPASRRGGGKG